MKKGAAIVMKYLMGSSFGYAKNSVAAIAAPPGEALIYGTGRIWAIWSVCVCAAAFLVLVYIWSFKLNKSTAATVRVRRRAFRSGK